MATVSARMRRRPWGYFGVLLGAAVLYLGVVMLSLNLVPLDGSGASLVWPPAAVGLAMMYFLDYEFWPAMVLPFFALLLARGIPPPTAAAVGIANLVEALIGTYMLRRMDFSPLFSRLRDSLTFLLTAVCATVVSGLITTATIYFFGSGHGVSGVFNSPLFGGLWVGHAVSLLSFGAFALRWGCRPAFTKTFKELVEGAIVFGLVVALNILIYWTPWGVVGGSISLIYILIPVLIWAALRTGPRGITLALVLSAIIAATGVLFGHGIVNPQNIPTSAELFATQLLIGTLSIIFLIFTSITEERKEAVVSLRGNIEKLSEALGRISNEDKAKSDFLAILAHELRNPLSSIVTSLEIMKQSGIREENIKSVDSIASQVHHMARMLDDLLDMSRISQRRFKIQKEAVDLNMLLDESIDMADSLITDRRHRVVRHVPENHVWIDGDPVRLGQVFVNLLNNSAKYTDPGGTIEVSLSQENGGAVVAVRDNGIGITPKHLSTIFEAVQRPNTPGPARGPGGLGIGLSLCKRLVELHGGTIEARSGGEGKGSEFVVRLPETAQTPLGFGQPTRRRRFAQRLRGRAPMRILMVDDNQVVAEGFAKLLEAQGHKVEVAFDAPEALKAAREFNPEVIVLDIGLPTFDGYEAARRLRAAGSRALLIALTGYGQEEDKRRARDAGFDAHLTKPVSVADIDALLAERQISSAKTTSRSL